MTELTGTTLTAARVLDIFLLLLIGVGPKIALVPYLDITGPLPPATKRRVLRAMLVTVSVVSVALLAVGELLTRLLHFSTGSLSIAGGVILLILAVHMVLDQPNEQEHRIPPDADPMTLASFPLAVPYLLNPAGIVALVTLSAEAASIAVFAVVVGLLVAVLLIDLAAFSFGNRISDHLNQNRMLVTEKVFGFLLAALAVQLALDGLSDVGAISLTGH